MVAAGTFLITVKVLKVSFLRAVVSFFVWRDSLGAFHAGQAPSLAPAQTESLIDGDLLASHHTNSAQRHV
jgi:hypothetical protein